MRKLWDMQSVRGKLENLKEHFPGQEKIIYDFGKCIAKNTNDELYAEGFNLAIGLGLYDVTKGYPLLICNILRMSIPQIVEAVCEAELAKEVAEIQSGFGERAE